MKSKFPVIRLKKDIEKLNEEALAPYAARSTETSRRYKETEGSLENRSDFQRDKDRIIHSAAFRRMMYKTQVFVNHEGDQFRTRLTHSMEVSQFARGIARSLALNEDLAEAIAIGHDIGHTPFGHAAEGVFSKKLISVGLNGFFHNEQGVRVVEFLENRDEKSYRGLNLTREVREGILKHNSDSTGSFSELEPSLPCRSVEGQLVRLVDTVAYTCHDLDDGIKSGILEKNCKCNKDINERFEETKRLIYDASGISISYNRFESTYFISALVSFFVKSIIYSTYDNLCRYEIKTYTDVENAAKNGIALAGISDEAYSVFLKLKGFVNDTLYYTRTVQMMDCKAEKVVGELFDAFYTHTELLPPEWKYRLDNYEKFDEYNFENGDKIKARLICDYISCMTDRYALEEYDRVFNPKIKI